MKRPRRRGERPRRRGPLLPFPSPPLLPLLGGGSPLARRHPPPGSSAGLREFSVPPPRPSPQGRRGRGGPGGPAAASAQRKLYPNKITELCDRDCPGRSGSGRAKAEACRDPGRGKAVSGAAAALVPAARKRPGWLPGGATLEPLLPQFRAEPSAAAASARRRKGASPHCQRHRSSLTRNLSHQRDF